MEEKRTFKTKLKTFIKECYRVLRITRKPSGDEFKVIVKASSIGILVIGAIGFIITMLVHFI